MKCESCGSEHDGNYGSGRFCSFSCSRRRIINEETKKKISDSIKNFVRKNGPIKHNLETRIKIGKTINSERKLPNNIFEISGNTRRKVLTRLNLSCFNCGWDKAKRDMHHIIPQSKNGSGDHSNLVYVCPNCHRMIHEGKIDINTISTFESKIGKSWLDHLYF